MRADRDEVGRPAIRLKAGLTGITLIMLIQLLVRTVLTVSVCICVGQMCDSTQLQALSASWQEDATGKSDNRSKPLGQFRGMVINLTGAVVPNFTGRDSLRKSGRFGGDKF